MYRYLRERFYESAGSGCGDNPYFWLYRLFAWRQWLPKDLPHESLSPLILFTIFSKGREARVRKKIYKSIRIFRGKADVGAYYLSEEFIEQLMRGKEYEFDEETLSEAGLTILPDRKYRGEKFIGIQRMGREDRSIR